MTYRWLGRLVALWCVLATLIVVPALLSACVAHAQARLDNLVSGSGNTTGAGATTIISAPTNSRRLYITSLRFNAVARMPVRRPFSRP